MISPLLQIRKTVFLYAYSVAKEVVPFYVMRHNILSLFLFSKPRKSGNVKGHGITEYPWVEAGLHSNPLQPVLQGILVDAENPCRLLDGQILLIIDLE